VVGKRVVRSDRIDPCPEPNEALFFWPGAFFVKAKALPASGCVSYHGPIWKFLGNVNLFAIENIPSGGQGKAALAAPEADSFRTPIDPARAFLGIHVRAKSVLKA
jgi:hypothetical protein